MGNNSTEMNCYCIAYISNNLRKDFCSSAKSLEASNFSSRSTQRRKTPNGLRVHYCLDKLKGENANFKYDIQNIYV